MKALEITLNGDKVCVAAIESGKGVFSTQVISILGLSNQPDSLSLNVSGLDSSSNDSLKWFDQELKMGDEIVVKIVDSKEIDPPAILPNMQAEAILNSKLKTYYQLKKELAEHIGE